jgi:PKD repeat protein
MQPKHLIGTIGFLLLSLFSHAQTPGIKVNNNLIAPGDTVLVCKGNALSYTSAATGATNIDWIFNGGGPSNGTGAGPLLVTYPNNGVFITKQKVTAGGNSDSMEIYVWVSDQKPTLTSITFTPNGQCGNIPVQFTSNASGASSYLWNFGDGVTDTTANPTHQYLNAIGISGVQPYTVTLTAGNTFGCTSVVSVPISVLKIPDALIGNTDPGVSTTTYQGLLTFRRCQNESNYTFTFVNQSSTTAINGQYTFDWGDGSPPTVLSNWPLGGSITHNYSQGNHMLTLKVTTPSNNCEGIKKYFVFLGGNPKSGLSSFGNTEYCTGQTGTFGIPSEVLNNPLGTVYTFTVNDNGPTQIFQHPPPAIISYTFNSTSCGTNSIGIPNSFIATFTATNPCKSTDAIVTQIVVSQKPKALFNILPGKVVCTNTPVTINNTSIFGLVVGEDNNCSNGGIQVWEITPAVGFTITPNNLGSINGSVTNTNGWTNGAPNLTLNFNTPGIYTIKLYITNKRCGFDTISQTICVRTPPQATFTMAPAFSCDQGTVQFTNTSPPGGCKGDLYNWSFVKTDTAACGNPNSNIQFLNNTNAGSASPIVQFTGAGVYMAKLTVSGDGASGCPVATASSNYVVKTKPKVSIPALAATCVGNSIMPTANISNCYGSQPFTVLWQFPNGSPVSSTLVNPGSVLYNAIGDYPITLTVTNECGSTTVTDTARITALPQPNAGPDTSMCSGSTINIGRPPVPGYTYSWLPTTGILNPTGANTPITLTYNGPNPDITYEYILTASAGANCRGADTIRITVKKNPEVDVLPLNATLCPGDTVQLAASGAITYSWLPVTGLNISNQAIVMATPASSTNYIVTGTGANGCKDTAQAIVIVNPLVTANAGPDTTVCSTPVPIQLIGSPANGGTWSGHPNVTSGGLFDAGAAGNGTYNLVYTVAQNNCSKRDTVIVNVVSGNSANGGNDTTVCVGTSAFQLTGSPAGGTWSGNPQVSSGGLVTPSIPGTYTLTYSFGSGNCRSTDNIILIVQPGVQDNTLAPDQTICINKQPNTIFGSIPSGGNGVPLYAWQSSTDNITWNPVPGISTKDYTPPVLSVTTWYRRIANTNLCRADTSQPVKITVQPNARALFTATSTRGCIDFHLENVINVTAFPNRNANYTWFANGVQIGSGPGAIFPPYAITTQGTTVVIKLLVTSSLGCESDSMEMSFSTVVNVVARFTKDKNQGCGPLTVNFSNTSSILTGVQHFWDFGNGISSTQVQPSAITYNFSPQYTDTTYYITLKSYNGCDTTYWRDSVKVLPPPRARFSPNQVLGCSPFLLRLHNTSLGLPATYYWDWGDGTRDTSFTPGFLTHIYNTGIIDTFTVLLIVRNACGVDSAKIDVVVSPNQIRPQINISGSQILGCANQPLLFFNNTLGASNFIWDFGDNTSLITTTGSPDIVPHIYTDTGFFVVKIQMSNNCTDTTAFFPVRILPRPRAQFSSPRRIFCINDTVRFNNTSLNGDAWRWFFGDGTTSIDPNPSHIYLSPGTYSVMLIAYKLNAFGTPCTDTARLTVQINGLPLANFSVSPSFVIKIPDFTFTFTNSTSNASNPRYTWKMGDGTIYNSRDVTHTYRDTGNYNVTLAVVNLDDGCTDSITKTVRIETVPGWLYVPNAICPKCSDIKLRTFLPRGSGIAKGKYRLQIYTTWGQLIWETTSLDAQGRPNEAWDGKYKGDYVQQDAYVWKIEAEYIKGDDWKGMKYPGQSLKRFGTLTIVH